MVQLCSRFYLQEEIFDPYHLSLEGNKLSLLFLVFCRGEAYSFGLGKDEIIPDLQLEDTLQKDINIATPDL